jgi:hypothetical protein
VNAGAAVFDALGGGWALRRVARFLLTRALRRLLASDVDGQQARRAALRTPLPPCTRVAAPCAERHARKAPRAGIVVAQRHS